MFLPASTCLRILLPLAALNAAAEPRPWPARGPRVFAFLPRHGPVGTKVTLFGMHLDQVQGVALGQVNVSFLVQDPYRVLFVVPPGAVTGPILVRAAGKVLPSPGAFTVDAAPPPPTPPPPTPPPTPPTPPAPPTPPPPGGVNLSIAGWYLTQGVQTLDRSVPLVAGKDGLLRVFVQASGSNASAPDVRVTIAGGVPSPWVQTLKAPGASVPTAIQEGELGSSWNVRVPGAVLTPASALTVELDPAQAVPDADRGDNRLSAPLAAAAVPPFRTTLVPVTQQGIQGDVTGGGRTPGSWVDRLQRMAALSGQPGGVDVQVGAPYATQANLNAGSGGWSQLLDELNRKRTAEGTGRAYFGAVGVSYAGGIAGLGYIGQPAAIGWDKSGYQDGGNYPEVFAHEVGHNFGRQHAPCGGPAGIDPAWPTDAAHTNAQIGAYGWDSATGALMMPSLADVMAYCHPVWVSDYTYRGILDFRASRALEEGRRPTPAAVRCLVVSGRFREGRWTLSPAFTITTMPVPPEGNECSIALTDPEGAVLREIPFTPARVADLPEGEEAHFAFALPLDPPTEQRLLGVQVRSGGAVLAMRRGGWRTTPQAPQAASLGAGQVRVTWDARVGVGAMVRDARTGEVLAFAEGGSALVTTGEREVVVELSNGVTSSPFRVEIR